VSANVIDTMHLGRDRVIAAHEVRGELIVDPGPESCIETLVEGLSGEPRALLLTHIHLDHAGATGALVRRLPDLRVYVSEIGAPHLVDPSKLLKSAGRLYGPENMDHLWGEVAPVPEERIVPLAGGEEVEGFRVEYVPGHAKHHVCWFHLESADAYVGDMAGVHIPPSELVVAPTPPPDIDVEAWERSLDLVAAWEPQRLALTHFGEVADVPGQLEACRTALRDQAELAGRHDMEGFIAVMRERVEREGGEVAGAFAQAAPYDHLWLGLDRWRRVTSPS
jgi:glyoxylase-like metal-dependent hydrolase (beta-lactamase superfamily II)